MANKRDRSNYLIQSVTHSLEVMDTLAQAGGEVGVTEIAKTLKLHKNNIFRILATLGLKGYVQQNPQTDAYTLGPACLKLGQSYLLSSDIVGRVRPILFDLNQEIRETVGFARVIGQTVHFPVSLSADREVAVTPRQGKTFAATDCTVGKMLLAHKNNSELTDSEMKKNNDLKAKMKSGCFVESSNHTEVMTIAAPVYGVGNSLLGGLEIMVPVHRADFEQLAPKVRKTIDKLNECFAASHIPLTDQIEKEISQGLIGGTKEDFSVEATA